MVRRLNYHFNKDTIETLELAVDCINGLNDVWKRKMCRNKLKNMIKRMKRKVKNEN